MRGYDRSFLKAGIRESTLIVLERIISSVDSYVETSRYLSISYKKRGYQ